MVTNDTSRVCLECGKKLIGRTDKKFCSDACRVAHFNRKGKVRRNIIKTVNRSLLNNYKLLLQLNRKGTTKVPTETLTKSKFNFEYYTSSFRKSNGTIYYYCYDQGYADLKNGYHLLVVRDEKQIHKMLKS